jgi:hypothetical protein
MKHIIFAPEFDDVTKFTYRWGQSLEKELKADWRGKGDCNRKEFEGAVGDYDTFIFYDHGNVDKLVAQDKTNLVDLENDEKLEGKLVYAMACSSAKELGPDAVEKGCKRYVGWSKPFAFITPHSSIFEDFTHSVGLVFFKDEIEKDLKGIKKRARFVAKTRGILTYLVMLHDIRCLEVLEH